MRKKGFIIVLLALMVLPFVAASDVAYIHSSVWGADSKIVDIFSDLGLSVEYIRCSDVSSTDFSEYDLIFVGNEWFACASDIPISEHASVVMNGRNTKEFGLVGRERISKIASASPLRVNVNNEIIQVYTRAKYSRRSISMYYLSRYEGNGFDKVAGIYIGGDRDLGAVVAHVNSGTELTNGETANENVCFFGIHQTRFWTDDAEELFKDCVEFAIGGVGGSVCGDGVVEAGETCDDGNLINGDGCSSSCGVEGSVSIKINEFESNPEGEDSGNEWAELYNPNAFDVDLTDWKLINNDGDEHIMSEIISANGYLVVMFSGKWLDNLDEGLVLKNNLGVEIDATIIGNDEANDDKTWQRIPNGFDTNSDSDWQFVARTKGFVN